MSRYTPTAEYLCMVNPTAEKILDTPEMKAWLLVLPKDGSALIWGVYGKAKKASFYARYTTRQVAEKWIEKAYHWRLERDAAKSADRAEKKAFKTSLKVGAILVGSWGYDQTNVEAFQVLEVSESGKSVVMQAVALRSEGETSWCSSNVSPVVGSFIGPKIRGMVQPGDRVPYKHCSLHLWNGKAMHSSWGC